jgi:hypothetical protein
MLSKNNIGSLIIFSAILLIYSCESKKQSNVANDQNEEFQLFSLVAPEYSGVGFKNLMAEENELISPFIYINAFSGGGVAIGDINNDGLSDLFFTGNNVYDRIFINRGNMQFIDITQTAGVNGGDGWSSGATMADVNGDGFLDIYISRCYTFNEEWRRENILYINNGDLTFTNKAKEYGINDTGMSVQSTFFDYDLDGDLDLYVGNHPWVYTLISKIVTVCTRMKAMESLLMLLNQQGFSILDSYWDWL